MVANRSTKIIVIVMSSTTQSSKDHDQTNQLVTASILGAHDKTAKDSEAAESPKF